MPAHFADVYSTRFDSLLQRAEEGPGPVEDRIRDHVRAGDAAFRQRRYAPALASYLEAWGLLPRLVLVGLPISVGRLDPAALLAVDLTPWLLAASGELHRLRPSIDPKIDVLAPVEPPRELVDLVAEYTDGADAPLRHQLTAATLLAQGALDLAKEYAGRAVGFADTEQQLADGRALLGAIALAGDDPDSAVGYLNSSAEVYEKLGDLGARAAVAHNHGVLASLAGESGVATEHFAAALTRLPAALDWRVTAALSDAPPELTRGVGQLGLPLVLRVAGRWDQVATTRPAPLDRVTLATRRGGITIDLTAGGDGVAEALLRPRVDATELDALHVDWADPDVFVGHLSHLQGFTLPISIGDTYHALGRYDLAATFFLKAARYRYLNTTIELPMVWTRLAQTYLAEAERSYRGQDVDTATAQYNRIAPSGPLSGSLYEGPFAVLVDETAAVLADPDPVGSTALDVVDFARRIVLLRARAALDQIAAGINYLGIPDAYVPIHSWRYLQNQARYFANQAGQAERAYLNFLSTAEKEEFTRLTLEQAVDAQRSAVTVETKKVELAGAQEDVARAGVDLARRRIDDAADAQADYQAVAEQVGVYDEISAQYSAPDGAVHLDPDYAQRLGLSVTYVHERYTGLTGTSDFYSVRDTNKSDILATITRSRSKLTRELELRNLGRRIDDLAAERDLAGAQVTAARRGTAVAKAQRRLAQLHQRQAEEQLAAFADQELTPELWDRLARTQREISRRYLDRAIGAAFLMQQAYEFEYDVTVDRIRFDYDSTGPDGLLGADLLLSDVDQFSYDRLLDTGKKAPVKVSIALADRFPYQFRTQFQQTGRLDFQTTLDDFDRTHPGTYRRTLRRVEVVVEGVVGADGLHGTLTNTGFATDRDRTGAVRTRLQRAETMLLSRFDLRGDGFAFVSTDEQVLAVFENSGVASGWVLELPPDVNDVDYRTITNVHLVLYYDAYHSDRVADVVKAELAAATREEWMLGLAMRFQYPDEFYDFRATGTLTVVVDEGSVPFPHVAPVLRTLHVGVETAEGVSAANLTLTVTAHGTTVDATTDANGVAGTTAGPLAALRGRPLLTTWTVRLDPAKNAAAFAAGLSWDDVTNLAFYTEYTYTPRGRHQIAHDFRTDPLAGFEVADDPRAQGRPSRWEHDRAAALVRQRATVSATGLQNTSADKPGAILLGRAAAWPARRDVLVRTRVSADGGGIGVVFRYRDPDNFYYFLMDADLRYRRIGRKVGGRYGELDGRAVDLSTGYTPGTTYEVAVAAVGGSLVVALNGEQVLAGHDDALPGAGRVGLLAWKNPTARFAGLSVRDV